MNINFIQARDKLCRILMELSCLPDDNIAPEKRKSFKLGLEYLNNKKFIIVIAGRFSVGKSMLINKMFLGEDLLPCGITPTTSRPIIIQYGPIKKFKVIKQMEDGQAEEVEYQAEPEIIKKFCTHQGDKQNIHAIFVLEAPIELLRNGVVLYDTIGTEDINDEYVNQTINSIAEAAVVIYVTNALQPLAQSEVNFLKAQIGGTPKRLFLVANKIDGRPNLNDRETIAEDLAKRFRDFYEDADIHVEKNIYLVSARTGEGLRSLLDNIITYLSNNQVREIVFQQAIVTNNIIEKELREINQYIEILQMKKDNLNDILEKKRQELQQLKDEIDSKQLMMSDHQSELVEFAEDEIRYALNEARDKVLMMLGNHNISLDSLTMVVERELNRYLIPVGRKISIKAMELLQSRLNKYHIIIWDKDDIQLMLTSIKPELEKFGGIAVIAGGGSSILFGIYQGIAVVSATAAQTMATKTWFWGLLKISGTGGSIIPAFLSAVCPWVLIGGAGLFVGNIIFNQATKKAIKRANENVTAFFKEQEKKLLNKLDQTVTELLDQINNKLMESVNNKINKLNIISSESEFNKLITDYERALQSRATFIDYHNKILKIIADCGDK